MTHTAVWKPKIAPSRICKFLCASGASPHLRRRLRRRSGAPRPRALRAPPPFPFSPTRKNCQIFVIELHHLHVRSPFHHARDALRALPFMVGTVILYTRD